MMVPYEEGANTSGTFTSDLDENSPDSSSPRAGSLTPSANEMDIDQTENERPLRLKPTTNDQTDLTPNLPNIDCETELKSKCETTETAVDNETPEELVKENVEEPIEKPVEELVEDKPYELVSVAEDQTDGEVVEESVDTVVSEKGNQIMDVDTAVANKPEIPKVDVKLLVENSSPPVEPSELATTETEITNSENEESTVGPFQNCHFLPIFINSFLPQTNDTETWPGSSAIPSPQYFFPFYYPPTSPVFGPVKGK